MDDSPSARVSENGVRHKGGNNGRIDGTDWAAGRKRALTPALILNLRQALLTGVPRNSAAALCHIAPSTLYVLLNTGRRDLARGNPSKEAKLLCVVESAEAEFQQQMINCVRRCGEGGIIQVPVRQADGSPVLDADGQPQMREVYQKPRWEASAWALERRFAETWGKKSELAVTHTERAAAREELDNDPGAVITLYQQAKALLQAAEDLQAERARKRAEQQAQLAIVPPEDDELEK